MSSSDFDTKLQHLAEIFPSFETPTLKQVLTACDGDMQLAIDSLYGVLIEEEEEEDFDYDDDIINSEMDLIGCERVDCGYCDKKNSAETFYATSGSITPQDLQTLCDFNWRRSGTVIYKHVNQTACCPYYTIRLPVSKFVPSKEHRVVLRNMDRYLETGSIKSEEVSKCKNKCKDTPELSPEESSAIEQITAHIKSAINDIFGELLRSAGSEPDSVHVNFTHNPQDTWSVRGKASCNVAIVLAGMIKKLTKGKTQISPKEITSKLSEYISSNKKISVEVPFVINDAGFINLFVTKREKSQTKDEPLEKKSKPKPPRDNEKHEPEHKIEYVINKSKFIQEEYELYKKYQINIHKDKPEEITQKSYTRFLIHSPIECIPIGAELPLGIKEYGSYHLQYKLDGKIVGVSVLDILPKCISSVYFFYDTDYEFLQLGKYSALWEIRYISDIIAKHACGIEYYYLGFYIPTIAKMRYKAQYKPSELLCEKTRKWVPLDACLPIFKKAIEEGHTGLVDIDPSAKPRSLPSEADVLDIFKVDSSKMKKIIYDFVCYTDIDFAKNMIIRIQV